MVEVLVACRRRLLSDLLVDALTEVGYTARTGPWALDDLARETLKRRPKAAITDWVSEPSDSTAITRIIATGCRLLVISEEHSTNAAIIGLMSGASGYLVLEDTKPQTFLSAVRAIRGGGIRLHPLVAQSVMDEWYRLRVGHTGEVGIRLTGREKDVLETLAAGLSTKEAARGLGLAVKTVESHRSRLYAKLGVTNQVQAITVATSHGLMSNNAERGRGTHDPASGARYG